MIKRISLKLGETELVLETGRFAKQANGAVYAEYAGTAVLATACCGDKVVEDLDYVPLQVEYNEKFYAAGKIPGGFLRREGRPKDSEILVCRLIDRPMRPLFDKNFKREIQIVPTVVSADVVNPPDVIAMVASSAAVCISDIPFDGPTGAVRVSQVDDELVINPTFDQIQRSTLDIIVAGTEHGITMVEGGAKEVPEELLLSAIEAAEPFIADICRALKQLAEEVGKEKLPLVEDSRKLESREEIWNYGLPLMEQACFVKGKMTRSGAVKQVHKDVLEKFEESISENNVKLLDALLEELEYEVVRESILKKGVRTDGRGSEDIRPIACEIDILPRTHGSALFTRGETQALAVATLGTMSDEKLIDDIEGEKRYESFMLHYNFPPFSVGETGRLGTGRREIGHGHLAQRAIERILPSSEDFPYTLRVVSEILESNGSSSMATVCASTLALLNAGVPVTKPVAGIAMGLVTDEKDTVILSDILGEEDHLGDMDFKVAGTKDGITAFQMDIKISKVNSDIMSKALQQAKKGRMHILDIMNKTIETPAKDISEFAPKIISFHIDQEKIGSVIGPGGKNIKAIAEKSKATINIDDDGKVLVYGKNMASAEEAEAMVKGMVEDAEVGKIYNGVVKRILDFGAFIEILPGKDGLCHISRLSRERVNKVEDVLSIGQEVKAKVIEIDRMGRINLSYIDAIDPDNDTGEYRQPPRNPNRGGPRR